MYGIEGNYCRNLFNTAENRQRRYRFSSSAALNLLRRIALARQFRIGLLRMERIKDRMSMSEMERCSQDS